MCFHFFLQAGCLYVYGVVVCIDHVMTSDVYTIWLKIPSLKDLCWDKVISSTSQLASMERERMQELGIPLEYMDRLKAWNIKEKIHRLVWARINLQARTSQACAEPANFVPGCITAPEFRARKTLLIFRGLYRPGKCSVYQDWRTYAGEGCFPAGFDGKGIHGKVRNTCTDSDMILDLV